jgi:hypothetical protein
MDRRYERMATHFLFPLSTSIGTSPLCRSPSSSSRTKADPQRQLQPSLSCHCFPILQFAGNLLGAGQRINSGDGAKCTWSHTTLVTVENSDSGVIDLQVVVRVAPCVSSLSFSSAQTKRHMGILHIEWCPLQESVPFTKHILSG